MFILEFKKYKKFIAFPLCFESYVPFDMSIMFNKNVMYLYPNNTLDDIDMYMSIVKSMDCGTKFLTSVDTMNVLCITLYYSFFS